MHTLMGTDNSQLLTRHRKDDMAEDDATKRKLAHQLAASRLAFAVGHFQRAR